MARKQDALDKATKAAGKTRGTVAKSKTRGKASMKKSRVIVARRPSPAPEAPSQIAEAFSAIGSEVGAALNTDVGRIVVAQLLIFVAKKLTEAAETTEAASDAKTALLNVGAKVGAATAQAGARILEVGQAADETGARLMDEGASIASAGVLTPRQADRHEGTTAGDLMREVAQVAVGALGGVVTEAAQNALGLGRSIEAPSRRPVVRAARRESRQPK